MFLFKKNNTSFHLKAFYLLLFISLLPLKSFGQEFDWVYATKGVVGENEYPPSGIVRFMAINDNNETYATGGFSGFNDFGDGQEDVFIKASNVASSSYLIKLDENKNILWAKSWTVGGSYFFSSININNDGDLIISGYTRPSISTLYFNLTPPNPAFPKILTPTHEGLSNDQYYGFILKLDAQGNYINTILFEDTHINDVVIDNNNDITAVGFTVSYSENPLINYIIDWSYITKLDTNLNVLWEKEFDNQNTNSYNGFTNIEIDSQNNIYCSGIYKNSFLYGTTTLEQSPSDLDVANNFVCKFLPDHTENWIIDVLYYTVPDMHIDDSDTIYFSANYTEPTPIQFNNSTVSDLPSGNDMSSDAAIFKIDVNANYIWSAPIYGQWDQLMTKFTINSVGELIVPIKPGWSDEFYFKNATTTIETNDASYLVLKIKPDGDLIDFKRLFVNTLEDLVGINAVHVDTNDNILLGGYFQRPTDFDPHPLNDYILSNDLFQNGFDGDFFHERRAYVLKLQRCDVVPLFNNTYEFCGGTTPNPTIGDIQPKALNVKWYLSSTSPTPLNDSFAIVDGQTCYYENVVESCPNFDRLPVIMNILPPPPPPIIEAIQPCFVQGLTLANLNITGENLAFYATLVGDAIADSTVIISDKIYYVSQTTGFCESQRIAVIISDYFGSSPNQHSIFFCKSNPNDITELINISDYNSEFIPSGAAESNYVFSYHNSFEDAEGNVNPITNFQNYQATIETVYVRIFSTQSLCFKITELIIDFSNPPIIEKIVTADWSNNNTITVLPNNANYSYSLDGIIYQNSNYFENLRAGSYTVFIKNEAGCFGKPEEVYLLNYPKFFTPNGDGYNDLWSINFSQLQDVFNVEIYDRYGKFIISFDKNHSGWDGKYNDIILPATDYWFRITRVSDTEIVYRGHFSLKR